MQNYIDMGIAGIALGVTYYSITALKDVINKKKLNCNGAPPMSKLACQVDPLHFGRIKDIHTYTEWVQGEIAAGRFGCAWKDRDEVRDLIEAMRNLTISMDGVASEMRKQNGR